MIRVGDGERIAGCIRTLSSDEVEAEKGLSEGQK
jgi:hypothetical protein